MDYELFSFLVWSTMIGFVLFLILGIVFIRLKKRRIAMRWFGFMIGCVILFVGLFQFAYPEELLNGTEPEDETVEVEKESISVQPVSISFNDKENLIDVAVDTNLPANSIVDITLNDSEGNYWGTDFDLTVNGEGKVKAEITPYDPTTYPQNDEYLIDLTIAVNGDDEDDIENSNEDFLFDSKLGGFASDLKEYYADSTEVTVTLEDGYNSFNYELTVSPAKTLLLDDGYSEEQVAQLQQDQEESTVTAEAEDDMSTETTSDSSYISNDSYDSFQESLKYATGTDWADYTFDEKFIAVETILQAMEASGTTIDADTYWFIEALNAYYEDGRGPGASEKIVDMIALSGVAGGVIIR